MITANLGRIVGRLNSAADSLLDDPMNDYAGFVPDPMPALERVAREEGFDSIAEVLDAVEDRTSARWVHFNCRFPV